MSDTSPRPVFRTTNPATLKPAKPYPGHSADGVKHSGFGRECANFGIREFVNIKSVYVKI